MATPMSFSQLCEATLANSLRSIAQAIKRGQLTEDHDVDELVATMTELVVVDPSVITHPPAQANPGTQFSFVRPRPTETTAAAPSKKVTSTRKPTAAGKVAEAAAATPPAESITKEVFEKRLKAAQQDMGSYPCAYYAQRGNPDGLVCGEFAKGWLNNEEPVKPESAGDDWQPNPLLRRCTGCIKKKGLQRPWYNVDGATTKTQTGTVLAGANKPRTGIPLGKGTPKLNLVGRAGAGSAAPTTMLTGMGLPSDTHEDEDGTEEEELKIIGMLGLRKDHYVGKEKAHSSWLVESDGDTFTVRGKFPYVVTVNHKFKGDYENDLVELTPEEVISCEAMGAAYEYLAPSSNVGGAKVPLIPSQSRAPIRGLTTKPVEPSVPPAASPVTGTTEAFVPAEQPLAALSSINPGGSRRIRAQS